MINITGMAPIIGMNLVLADISTDPSGYPEILNNDTVTAVPLNPSSAQVGLHLMFQVG